MSEKCEPRWRRWGDEKPVMGQMIAYGGGEDEVCTNMAWTGFSADLDTRWMPLSEWQAVLDAIPGPADPDEWFPVDAPPTEMAPVEAEGVEVDGTRWRQRPTCPSCGGAGEPTLRLGTWVCVARCSSRRLHLLRLWRGQPAPAHAAPDVSDGR